MLLPRHLGEDKPGLPSLAPATGAQAAARTAPKCASRLAADAARYRTYRNRLRFCGMFRLLDLSVVPGRGEDPPAPRCHRDERVWRGRRANPHVVSLRRDSLKLDKGTQHEKARGRKLDTNKNVKRFGSDYGEKEIKRADAVARTAAIFSERVSPSERARQIKVNAEGSWGGQFLLSGRRAGRSR